jgi:hypothetical protein
MVLAEAVREEVERNVLVRASALEPERGNEVLSDYVDLIALAKPEVIAMPLKAEVVSGRALIAHAADVPVLLSAIRSKPDWLLTNNTKHFTPAVARKTGLRIATPIEFFQALTSRFLPFQ